MTNEARAWSEQFKRDAMAHAEHEGEHKKLITRLRATSGQLRHAYWLLQNTRLDNQDAFAEGLISPQIRRIEECADELEQTTRAKRQDQ